MRALVLACVIACAAFACAAFACAAFACAAFAGCAAAPMRVPAVSLPATSGPEVVLPRDLGAARFTVLVFFAKSCGCFEVHQDRLRGITERFAHDGVRLVIVDSESGRTVEGDAGIASQRALPWPIVLDRGAQLARALKAEFATYAVVLDPTGKVHYRGAIDSDKSHLRDDARSYLADALADLVAGREPATTQTEPLGCVLQTW